MAKFDSNNVVYLGLDDDLRSVLACFKVNNISHIPIISEGKLVGMVSKTDVVEKVYERINELESESFKQALEKVKVKELMIQPVIEAKVDDSQMIILEKLLSHEVGSVVLKNGSDVVGIVTEKDMLRYLTSEKEEAMSFSEKMGLHIVQWLDKNGVIRISRMLADLGI